LAKRDSFLLRIDPEILNALRRWADDDLRSVNGQIEFLLRQTLSDAGRLPGKSRKAKRRRVSKPPPGSGG
jgi:hypothetical protein